MKKRQGDYLWNMRKFQRVDGIRALQWAKVVFGGARCFLRGRVFYQAAVCALQSVAFYGE